MNIAHRVKATSSKWTLAPPASTEVISSLREQLGIDLPQDYLDFLSFSNGGSGDLPVQPWLFDPLWPAEQLAKLNSDYEVSDYCPGFFGIGSSGGDEMFAFDMRSPQPWPIVCVPFIGMAPDEALLVAPDFSSFVSMFGEKSASAST